MKIQEKINLKVKHQMLIFIVFKKQKIFLLLKLLILLVLVIQEE